VRFANRTEAGRRLAQRLAYVRGEDVVVLGLPRGGVPVALQVAEALGAPLDVIVVRKLGLPFQPELAMGAIGEDGVRVINEAVVTVAGVSLEEMFTVERRERAELERRARRFRGDRARISLKGRTVIIVDDGIATGSTARAACQVARAQGARRIVLAVPVAPPGWTKKIHREADEFVALETPEEFIAVGQFYTDFSPTTDEEVSDCLERAAGVAEATTVREGAIDDPPGRDEEVTLGVGSVQLTGHLTVPEGAAGIVVFVHGSGSSRHSARNRFVAGVLNGAGLGTLLFDLLTADEELERANVFDIDLLAGRLLFVTRWVAARPRSTMPGSVTSAPARAPPPPCGLPQSLLLRSLRSSHAADVPISPPPAWTLSRRRPSLSWGVTTTSSSASTARPNPTCGATTALSSFPAQPTCSKRRVHSKPSPNWPGTGSWIIWPGPRSPSPDCKGVAVPHERVHLHPFRWIRCSQRGRPADRGRRRTSPSRHENQEPLDSTQAGVVGGDYDTCLGP